MPRKSIVPGSLSSINSLNRNPNNSNSLPPPPDKPRPAIPPAFIKPQVGYSYEDSAVLREQLKVKVSLNYISIFLFIKKSSFTPKLKDMSNNSETFDHSVQLKYQPWFHGILPRFIVDELLINNGDFLVRVKISFCINLN